MIAPIVLWMTIALSPTGEVLGTYASPSVVDCATVAEAAQAQNPGLNVQDCQQVLFGGEAPAPRADVPEAP